MMPVGRVSSAAIVGSGRTPHASLQAPSSRSSSRQAPPEAVSPQRALVQIAPVGPATGIPVRQADGRAAAPFLAHLIATVQGAPQTRERRRADPNRAITAYAAAMQVPESAGHAVRESR
jgi:hypothetical protein